jgi:hypothetical protein
MLPGFNDPQAGMNVGKTLFAQMMEFVPWKSFGRMLEKHARRLVLTKIG